MDSNSRILLCLSRVATQVNLGLQAASKVATQRPRSGKSPWMDPFARCTRPSYSTIPYIMARLYETSGTDFMAFRMGELEPWIDENFVRSVWFNMGEQVNVKMIRDKFSGYVGPFSFI